MLNFKKVYNLSISIALSLLLFSDNLVYASSLRIPVGQRGTYKRVNAALESNSGLTTSRRKFFAAAAGGAFALQRALQAAPVESKVSATQISQENEEMRLKLLTMQILKELGCVPAKLDALSTDIAQFLKKININNFKERFREAQEKKDVTKMINILDNLYFDYAANLSSLKIDTLAHVDTPRDKLLKALVSSFDKEDGIFSFLERQPSQAIPEKTKQYLIKELLRCTAKGQMAYFMLRSAEVKNIRVANGPEHVFNMVDLGNGQYLIVDFSNGKVFKIDLSENSPYYYKKGQNYYLKNKMPSKKVGELLKRYNSEGSKFLKGLSMEEILNMFYGSIHIAPEKTTGLSFAIRFKRGLTYFTIGEIAKGINDVNSAKILFNVALAEYKQARSLEPTAAEVLANLGNSYSSLNRNEEAYNILLEAVKLDSENSVAYTNLGVVCVRMGRWDEAKKYFKRSLEIDPDSNESVAVYCNLGDVYLEQKNYANALEWYKKGLAIDPKDVPLHYKFGKASRGLGDYKEAIRQLEIANKLKPNTWEIFYEIGLTYAQSEGSDSKKAFENFVKAGMLNKEIPELLRKENIPESIIKKIENKISSTYISKAGSIPIFSVSFQAFRNSL